jgi:hypothetical protein
MEFPPKVAAGAAFLLKPDPAWMVMMAGSQSRGEEGVNGLKPSLRAKRSNPSRRAKEEWIASSLRFSQ